MCRAHCGTAPRPRRAITMLPQKQLVAFHWAVMLTPPKQAEKARIARSLREISVDLVDPGFVNEYAKPYHPQSIQRMIDGDRPSKKEEGSLLTDPERV